MVAFYSKFYEMMKARRRIKRKGTLFPEAYWKLKYLVDLGHV